MMSTPTKRYGCPDHSIWKILVGDIGYDAPAECRAGCRIRFDGERQTRQVE